MSKVIMLILCFVIWIGGCSDRNQPAPITREPDPFGPNLQQMFEGIWTFPDQTQLILEKAKIYENTLTFVPASHFQGKLRYSINQKKSTCSEENFSIILLKDDGQLRLLFDSLFSGNCTMMFSVQAYQGDQLIGENHRELQIISSDAVDRIRFKLQEVFTLKQDEKWQLDLDTAIDNVPQNLRDQISYKVEARSCQKENWKQFEISERSLLLLEPRNLAVGHCEAKLVAKLGQFEANAPLKILVQNINDPLTILNLPTRITLNFDDVIDFAIDARDPDQLVVPDHPPIQFRFTNNQCQDLFSSTEALQLDPNTGRLSGRIANITSPEGCSLKIQAFIGDAIFPDEYTEGQLTIIVPDFPPKIFWNHDLSSSEGQVRALDPINLQVQAYVRDGRGSIENAKVSYELVQSSCRNGWLKRAVINQVNGVISGQPSNLGANSCELTVSARWQEQVIEKVILIKIIKIEELEVVDPQSPMKVINSPLILEVGQQVSFQIVGYYSDGSHTKPIPATDLQYDISSGLVEVTQDTSQWTVKGQQAEKVELTIKAFGIQRSITVYIKDRHVKEVFFGFDEGEKVTQIFMRPGESLTLPLFLWSHYLTLSQETIFEKAEQFALSSSDEVVLAIENQHQVRALKPGLATLTGELLGEQFSQKWQISIPVEIRCYDFESFEPSTGRCIKGQLPIPDGDLFVSSPIHEKKRFQTLDHVQACADLIQLEFNGMYYRLIGCQVDQELTLIEHHIGQVSHAQTMRLTRQGSSCGEVPEDLRVIKPEKRISGSLSDKEIRLIDSDSEKSFLYGNRDYYAYSSNCQQFLRRPTPPSSKIILDLCLHFSSLAGILTDTQKKQYDDSRSKLKVGCFIRQDERVIFEESQI